MDADVTLVVMGTSWCGYCKAMKKARVVERFSKEHPQVKVRELNLPNNWGDEEGLKAAAKKAILDARSAEEKEAVALATKHDIQGVPFVAFFDAEGGKLAEADGSVNLIQLENLYQEALEKLEDEGDEDDNADENDDEDDDNDTDS